MTTGGLWLKGNLHAHSTKSDGTLPPQEVVNSYASRGYDFLMLSEHDVFTSADDLSKLASRGMILIPGNEVTAGGPHLLHVNASRKVTPDPRRQSVLNEIATDSESLALVCHPNWLEAFDYATDSQLREWVGYAGIEIYNGVIGELPGSTYATDKWDILLTQGRKVWGFANDDSHTSKHIQQGWNVVHARSKSLPDIMEAFRQGDFYASTGVVIRELRVEGGKIRLETENAERIVALRQSARRFAVADSSSIEIEVPPQTKYVRFECWGRGESFAWTQPIFIPEN